MDMDKNLPQNAYKKALIWLGGGHFINDIYTGVLNPIMPFIAAKIGISMAIATIILTISHIFSSLLQPLFGFFADNNVKRSFIFWGLILSSLFIPMSAMANKPLILVLFIIIGSIGSVCGDGNFGIFLWTDCFVSNNTVFRNAQNAINDCSWLYLGFVDVLFCSKVV